MSRIASTSSHDWEHEDLLDDTEPFDKIYFNADRQVQNCIADCSRCDDTKHYDKIYLGLDAKVQNRIADCRTWDGRISHKLGTAPMTHNLDVEKVFTRLNLKWTMDWTRKSKQASTSLNYFPEFRINTFRVVGRPLRPIAPYGLRHATNTLPFELNDRTFRFASGPEFETWFVVLHPVLHGGPEQPESFRTETVERCSMRSHHAEALAEYINYICLALRRSLIRQGVYNEDDSYNNVDSVSFEHWWQFQSLFMQRWPNFVKDHRHDKFWGKHRPAFHVLDHRKDDIILVADAEKLSSLRKEVTIPENEDEDEDEDDNGGIVEDRDQRSERPAQPGEKEDKMFTGELENLKTSLGDKYNLEDVDRVSYTLGVIIHCCSDSSSEQRCLLANRSGVCASYGMQSAAPASKPVAEFHPLAFNPGVGNFWASKPPKFIEPQLTILSTNMAIQNESAEDVLCFEAFRGYSHGLEEAVLDKVTQGRATAALTLSPSVARRSPESVRAKHAELLNTPPSHHFRAARESIQDSIRNDYGTMDFRFDQVVTVRTSLLVPARRGFKTVLRPTFQFMKFFLEEVERYTTVLQSFKPDVFPGILCGFARHFQVSLEEMERRYAETGDEGLTLASCEAIALLDRLGEYCFTGDPAVLPYTVLEPLGTMKSIQNLGWPSSSYKMFCPGGDTIGLAEWPRLTPNDAQEGSTEGSTSPERPPILVHVPALGLHFGSRVAANQHSLMWFRNWDGQANQQELLNKALLDLWVPQMAGVLAQRIRVQLNRASRQLVSAAQSNEAKEISALLTAWEADEQQFTMTQYDRLFGQKSILPLLKLEPCEQSSRRNYAVHLSQTCRDFAAKAVSTRHGSWLEVFQNLSCSTPGQSTFATLIETALASAGIEWAPWINIENEKTGHFLKIQKLLVPTNVAANREIGSRKRNAERAEMEMHRHDAQPRKRVIDFGIDFHSNGTGHVNMIPQLIQDGFEALKSKFRHYPPVLEHFALAYRLLQRWSCAGHFEYDLLIMLVMTLSGSSRSLYINIGNKEHGYYFDLMDGTRDRRGAATYAAIVVTRMLWHLEEKLFNSLPPSTASKQVVAKRVEQYKVTFWLMFGIGWVVVTKPDHKRRSLREDMCSMPKTSALMGYYRELDRLRLDDPDRFIERIFISNFNSYFNNQRYNQKYNWVKVCKSIYSE
ncbi:hypothetical protein E4U14_005153 [Claviceps sp. LM454 group G7]|nr:hypothetical protein E4U14_005153 [Claviceps sp. LM454 group G7]